MKGSFSVLMVGALLGTLLAGMLMLVDPAAGFLFGEKSSFPKPVIALLVPLDGLEPVVPDDGPGRLSIRGV